MKPFFALYVKELKANKILFLFLLLLIVGMNAYGLSRTQGVSDISLGVVWTIVTVCILVLSLPFLLAHAFNTEWKAETHYLMFALPVSQYAVILAKIAAVASVGFVGAGIVIGSIYLWMVSTADLPTVKIISFGDTAVTAFFDVVFLLGLLFVTYMIFIFGLVTAMEGVKFSVKRYRGLTAVVFFFISVYLYGRFFVQGNEALDFLGEISIFAYTILMGILFLIFGLVVYEKRAEI